MKIDWNNPDLDLDSLPWMPEDLDRVEWFIQEKENINNNITEILNNLSEAFYTKVEKIKAILWIDTVIKDNKLSLYKNNDFIWEIFISKYIDWDFKRDIHLYNVIEDKYKWKWYWKIMFELYTSLSEENNNFILPEEEYTNVVSMINLYKKFWYIPKYKIINWMDYFIELDITDFEEMEKIISNYKEWYKEQKLWYTVVLEKEE